MGRGIGKVLLDCQIAIREGLANFIYTQIRHILMTNPDHIRICMTVSRFWVIIWTALLPYITVHGPYLQVAHS
jgi:Na+-transporting NADH:ubiquinone oxidoreductase subunit NqrB